LGITHAVDNCGVQVINLSLGGSSTPPGPTVVQDALQHAADHGVISVAAAGNSSSDASTFYPCAYGPGHPMSTAELVMCVSATDSSDNFASSFSNFGNPVDISAPGVNILSTYRGSYAYLSGTSMATPHVAAVVALVMSQFPSYTRDQVWDCVLFGAEGRGDAGWNAYYGWGRLNAYLALSAVTVTITTLYTSGTTTATVTSYTSTTTSTSTIPALTTVVLVPVSMTSTVQSTQYLTSTLTTTVTSYTSTSTSTSTIPTLTTVVLVPSTVTSTVESTQFLTSTLTTTVTSYTAMTTSTSTSVVYTTVTKSGAVAAVASSPLVYLGFLSLLALTVGHTVTTDKGWRIPRSRSRMERRRSTS